MIFSLSKTLKLGRILAPLIYHYCCLHPFLSVFAIFKQRFKMQKHPFIYFSFIPFWGNHKNCTVGWLQLISQDTILSSLVSHTFSCIIYQSVPPWLLFTVNTHSQRCDYRTFISVLSYLECLNLLVPDYLLEPYASKKLSRNFCIWEPTTKVVIKSNHMK